MYEELARENPVRQSGVNITQSEPDSAPRENAVVQGVFGRNRRRRQRELKDVADTTSAGEVFQQEQDELHAGEFATRPDSRMLGIYSSGLSDDERRQFYADYYSRGERRDNLVRSLANQVLNTDLTGDMLSERYMLDHAGEMMNKGNRLVYLQNLLQENPQVFGEKNNFHDPRLTRLTEISGNMGTAMNSLHLRHGVTAGGRRAEANSVRNAKKGRAAAEIMRQEAVSQINQYNQLNDGSPLAEPGREPQPQAGRQRAETVFEPMESFAMPQKKKWWQFGK